MPALGKDFFKWFRFFIAAITQFATIFGDDADKAEAEKNGFTK